MLVVSEAAIIVGGYLASLRLTSEPDPLIYFLYDGGLEQISIITAVVLLSMYFKDLYSKFNRSRIDVAYAITSAFGIALMAESLLSYLWPPLVLRSTDMILGSFFGVVGLLLWREVYGRYVLQVVGTQSVIFVGNSPLIQQITEEVIARPERGIRILGYIANDSAEVPSLPGRYLGEMATLESKVHELQPHRIVVGFTDRRGQLPVQDLLSLRFAGFVIQEAATLFEETTSRLSLWALRPSDLIFSGRLSPKRRTETIHGITDVVIASIAVLCLLPVFVLLAIAIKLTSRGPVFYPQERIGLNGKPFRMLKFRTMVEPEDGSEARVTSIGNFMRASRLNELPQLLNVLKREMSIVGPRPERPEYVAVFMKEIPFYGHRHSVRPGITGWAQINYGHADSVEDTLRKLEFDLYYIKNMSNALDMYIIFSTAKTLLLAQDSG